MPSALLEGLLLNAAQASLPRSQIPAFLYGCAWKKDRTADLVHRALDAGFHGIDVAAQPKHYREDLAGAGVRKALLSGRTKREELFLQTKFTSVQGQDADNLPYDPTAPVAEQVHASIASSLRNMRAEEDVSSEIDSYLDSLVLHSPLPSMEETMQAWRACEEYVPQRIRNLGISNTTLPILKEVFSAAKIKPAVVQNRFYPGTRWDGSLRRFCREKGIIYQSFWTLSANPQLLRSRPVASLAKAAVVSKEVAFYALVLGLENTVVLNGTTTHMKGDLEELDRCRVWALDQKYEWENTMKQFRGVIEEFDMAPPGETHVGSGRKESHEKMDSNKETGLRHEGEVMPYGISGR